MITKQSMSNDTYNTINEIDSIYKGYKYVNALYYISLTFLGSILLYNIHKMNIGEDMTKNIIMIFSCFIFTIIVYIATSRSRRLECRDTIFSLAINYYKAVYNYIDDAKIEKISYFDMLDIASVCGRCVELKILNKAQLNNLLHIVEDLINKSKL